MSAAFQEKWHAVSIFTRARKRGFENFVFRYDGGYWVLHVLGDHAITQIFSGHLLFIFATFIKRLVAAML